MNCYRSEFFSLNLLPVTFGQTERNRMNKYLKSGIISLGIMIGGATASIADTPPCGADRYCFYENAGFNGWNGNTYSNPGWVLSYLETYRTDNFGSPKGSTGNYFDQLTSAINNTNTRVCIYENGYLLFAVHTDSSVSYNQNWNDLADFGL